jgi:putative flippase GtrA
LPIFDSKILILRWLKFNAVGLLGVGVQLAMLAALTAFGMDYLPASALAVESAVLHNFVWHERFTWADRTHAAGGGWVRRLLYFHAANGAISLCGNLLLMPVLVHGLRLPVLLANLASIAVCSLANFTASEELVFG